MLKTLGFIFIILNSIACGENGNKVTQPTKSTKDTVSLVNDVESGIEDISEMGILKEVEDSGYPFATLTIEFPERNFKEYFTINMEEVKNASINQLNSYVNRYVKFTYTTEFTYALLDMYHESKSIFGAEVSPEGESIKSIEGVLYGAEQITDGDIPGEVSVFADDGENLYFQFFVTQEMVNVNEKRVTAFYERRTLNTITSIKMLKK
jgi:hypothetical protein